MSNKYLSVLAKRIMMIKTILRSFKKNIILKYLDYIHNKKVDRSKHVSFRHMHAIKLYLGILIFPI